MVDTWLHAVDHLVYAAPELNQGVDSVEQLLGVRARFGGAHPGRGTHMALLALGPATYLEIIAPDPDQPTPEAGRWLGLDDPSRPRLATWAAKTVDIDRVAHSAAEHGVELGTVREGRRARPDGAELRWQLTDPQQLVAGGIIPFFIDWGDSAHPAASVPTGARLVDLHAEHPQPDAVIAALRALGLDLRVEPGPEPAMIATIDGPNGMVELR